MTLPDRKKRTPPAQVAIEGAAGFDHLSATLGARRLCAKYGHQLAAWYSGVGPGHTVRCRRCKALVRL